MAVTCPIGVNLGSVSSSLRWSLDGSGGLCILRWPCWAAPTACSSAAVCVVCSVLSLARSRLGERVYACVQSLCAVVHQDLGLLAQAWRLAQALEQLGVVVSRL